MPTLNLATDLNWADPVKIDSLPNNGNPFDHSVGLNVGQRSVTTKLVCGGIAVGSSGPEVRALAEVTA